MEIQLNIYAEGAYILTMYPVPESEFSAMDVIQRLEENTNQVIRECAGTKSTEEILLDAIAKTDTELEIESILIRIPNIRRRRDDT